MNHHIENNEIVNENNRNSIEQLLIQLYNEFINNINMNVIELNSHFAYTYHIYINMYNDETMMYNNILQMFNEYNNILIDLQTNYTYEKISPELILESCTRT